MTYFKLISLGIAFMLSHLVLTPTAWGLESGSSKDTVQKSPVEIERAIRQGMADYPIALFKIPNDLSKKRMVLLLSDDAEADAEKRIALKALKQLVAHWSRLKEKPSFKARMIEGILKSAAILTALTQPYRFFHKETLHFDYKSRFIKERLENKDYQYSQVLSEIHSDRNILLGSLAYSTYIALGHFLKPALGGNVYFRKIFLHEAFKMESETRNAVSEIVKAVQNKQEETLFFFGVSPYLFEDVKSWLSKLKFDRHELGKFPDDEDELIDDSLVETNWNELVYEKIEDKEND